MIILIQVFSVYVEAVARGVVWGFETPFADPQKSTSVGNTKERGEEKEGRKERKEEKKKKREGNRKRKRQKGRARVSARLGLRGEIGIYVSRHLVCNI